MVLESGKNKSIVPASGGCHLAATQYGKGICMERQSKYASSALFLMHKATSGILGALPYDLF
jgi:hypothetical protein